jgi:hypothetical protein
MRISLAVSRLSHAARAMPKSVNMASPSCVRRILLGFTSR